MIKKEKAQALIDSCISKMNDEDKIIYRPIAEYAAELGYTPKQIKTAGGVSEELVFTKSRIKRTLLRIHPTKQATPTKILQTGKAGFKLFFCATPQYSEPFQEGIKRVIEAYDGKYTGCSRCGRCKGESEGYTYVYPDGKMVFRCGGVLIALHTISKENIEEIRTMMKTQDDFWMKQTEI